ncbi:MAG: hypothetical protein IH845_02795 [Nanoarchaeota archaeon]|nr:hypothetical protein [Nanoarchaeota archaeon]
MLGKKCNSCDKRVSSKFDFCPHCGDPFNGSRNSEDFGMFGSEKVGNSVEDIKLPFGMEKMVNSLVKQLEKQMGQMDFTDGNMPRGFKIHVSTGGPPNHQQIVTQNPKANPVINELSAKESDRRNKLPRVEIDSRMRRLSDRIIYEMETPGVRSKGDVVLGELATGLEIRAYSSDKCYVKFIPLKVEVIGYYLKNETLFVELKV